jgi:hypothetical protein
MGLLDLIVGRRGVTVYDVEPTPNLVGDGAVKGREVCLWRPPAMMDTQGRTMPGVSKELIAHYLVSAVSAMTETDLGPVTVEWAAQEGRFVTTKLTIHAWGQSVEILHPVAVVSQKLANAMELYQSGIVAKVRELHKRHQNFDQVNRMIRRAMRDIEKLRDDRVPHFNDAEYLFIHANMGKGVVLSALIPVADHAAEQALGGAVSVGLARQEKNA